MSNKKYKYSYNISVNANEKDFLTCCKLIEKGLPNITKEELLIDVDGSLIQIYHYFGKDKYSSLNLKYLCEEVKEPSNEEMENAREIFKEKGLFVITDN